MVRAVMHGVRSLRKCLRAELLTVCSRPAQRFGDGLSTSVDTASDRHAATTCGTAGESPPQECPQGSHQPPARVTPGRRPGQRPTRKSIAGKGLWGWSGPVAGRFVGHTPERGRKASTRPHAPQGTSLPIVMPWGSWHYGRAAERRDQNGNRTPKVTAKSSLTSSLTASCTSESRRRYGLGLYSIPIRSGQDVSVVVSRPTSMRENSSAAPP